MKIGIGIDTGGTYTDAVIYDFETRGVLGTAKALTTRDDLSVGILRALDALPARPLRAAEIISLSTTLATNACVEDKGGSAKLFFFGGDRKIIDAYGGEYGLPPSDEIYVQESFTPFSDEAPREPDWCRFCENLESACDGFDGAAIIEMNAMKNSAAVEKKAKELFQKKLSIPVVCAHELSNELNCLQRGASTLLNARLFPVIEEFLRAIKAAIKKRGINAAVVIVRSDGSLMSEEFARIRPVETLLCGPAASVMGSCLTGGPNSIVVDMGGTTTDIALVHNGVPLKAPGGVHIGKWKSFAGGLYIKTFGLGGDSAIHYADGKLFLEDYRVVPLCAAAEKAPQIIDNLKKLNAEAKKHTRYLHEHFILIKDIAHNARYSPEEKMFAAALKDGPKILREAAASVPGKDIYNLNVSRLLKEGVVEVCGLTPTDIMHITGDFARFPAEASLLGARCAARNLDISVAELCGRIYDEIKRKLYVNIVTALLENKNSRLGKNGVSKDTTRFINESYEIAKTGFRHEFLSMMFHTDFTITGVGAPVHIFLDDVAKMLGTKAVIPEHYEVANALGAITGNVYVSNVVEIRPEGTIYGLPGYTVFGGAETKVFATLPEAEAFAAAEAKNGAIAEALRRGAKGEISVSCALNTNEAEGRDCAIYLGTQAVARAIGSPGF